MALQIAVITGTIALPDGTPPLFGSLIFSITGWAKDAPHIVAPEPVEASTGSDGTFTCNLQATSDKRVQYKVELRYRRSQATSETLVTLGVIEVGPEPSYVLADLLPDPWALLPTVQSVSFKRGDTISVGVIIMDRNGHPQDLSALDVQADLKAPDGSRKSFQVTVSSDATSGVVELLLGSSESETLPLGEHQVDIKRMSADGFVRRSPTFKITIREEVTL